MLFTRDFFRQFSRTAISSIVPALLLPVSIIHAQESSMASKQFTRVEEVVTGEFELLDQHGNLVNQSTYNGKLRLVFFGFTECPDICPTTMANVAGVMRLLGDKSGQVQPLFFTVDPENDTVARLATYVSAFHPAIVGLTGSDQQVQSATKAFSVTYGRNPGSETNGLIDFYHSSYLYLMDRQGKFLDVFGYGTQPDIIVSRLQQYLD
jgi:protein SCO1/2